MTLTNILILAICLIAVFIIVLLIFNNIKIDRAETVINSVRLSMNNCFSKTIESEVDAKLSAIDIKLNNLASKMDDIINKKDEITLDESFMYKDEKYVVDGITTSLKRGEVEEINVHLVKGKSVLIRW